MKYNKETHKRKSIRLKGYDYSQAGFYFVTICTSNRECIFGIIENGEVILNEYGEIVKRILLDLMIRFDNIRIDKSVVMPNHIHLIIIINNREYVPVGVELALPKNEDNEMQGTASYAPTISSLPKIMQGFKSLTTIEINRRRNLSGVLVWQRNYYEHVIRNEYELFEIREYIEYNPLNWEYDELHN